MLIKTKRRMEEFIKNFNEFKNWLDCRKTNCTSQEERNAIESVVNKFNELNLDNAF